MSNPNQDELRPIDDLDLEQAAVAAASIRALFDPMSGRIDNWSER